MNKITIHLLAFFLAFFINHVVALELNEDWHTQSNYQQIKTTHVKLNLTVDFGSKQLKGSIEHAITRVNKNTNQLMLDTRDLEIHKIEYYNGKYWSRTEYKLAEKDEIRGSQLIIELPKLIKTNSHHERVRIFYNSQPNSTGLQWLKPAQTAGKQHPFVYSQSQAIHARSWMPIQDTPSMRVTYNATIKTPSNLRAVMSAVNNPIWNQEGLYNFEMPQPIPAYLIAIAAGNIHYKKMSRQTGVYAEPSLLNIAAKEFDDTQSMIEATEALYGPYLWGKYDLLILPPSFPYGGMENPRLSFITPTIIAGDKSLVNLIAHELAHSWSGNLVTNASWRDLWLNEGFTSYVENRIMEAVYGKNRASMEQTLSVQALQAKMPQLPVLDTRLHVEIKNRDPDDAFSIVPYTKGMLFLMSLEQKFGRKIFDKFLRGYFADFAFKSIDTHHFIEYINDNLVKKYPNKITLEQIKEWINEPLLPVNAPKPSSNAFTLVQNLMDNWLTDKVQLNELPTQKWSTHEWLYFINNLPKDVSLNQLKLLDSTFQLTQSTNNEIAHAWLLLNIKKNNPAINQRLREYMMTIGRRKLIVPLYKSLLNSHTNNITLAKFTYKQARAGYHSLAQRTIDKLFDEKKISTE